MWISTDFGGAKIEIAALDDNGGMVVRRRMPILVRYKAAIAVLVRLVGKAEAEFGRMATAGMARNNGSVTSPTPLGAALPVYRTDGLQHLPVAGVEQWPR